MNPDKDDKQKDLSNNALTSPYPKTLFQKIWDKHLIKTIPGGPDVIYVDKHFIHEVTARKLLLELKKEVSGFSGLHR